MGLLDHLVRSLEKRLRDGEAECLRRLEIDDQLEFRGLLDRQIGRLGALQDFVDLGGGLPELFGQLRPVRDEATRFDILPSGEHGRESRLLGKLGNPTALRKEQRSGKDVEA